MRIKPPKVLYIPINGVVDIRSVVPMVDAPAFQRLRDRKQLSLTDIAFPAARHSRFEHSIGAFAATRRLGDRWMRQGIIDNEMRRALMGYALYHDIGHAAFSHVTEDFAGDHKIRTQKLVTELRGEIEASNINFDLMYSLVTHENPLHAAVSDKNIGMEKLDYLERDGMYTGIGRPTGIDYLRKYTYFAHGHVCVDEKMVGHVQDTLDFYMQMYKDVYLRKCVLIAQRVFHKMIHYVVSVGEIDGTRIAAMTDPELLGAVSCSQHSGAKRLLHRLLERRLFKEVVVLRTDTHIHETRRLDKRIMVVGVSESKMAALMQSNILQKANHAGLENVERRIARLLQIDATDVAVVPIAYPERFVPKDVHIYGSDGALHSLKARRPRAFESMHETALSYRAIRVCVPDEYRSAACIQAQAITEIVQEG